MNELAERTENPFGATAPHAQSGLVSVEQQKAIAEVQAALIMARAQPRDQIAAMDKILQDCMRPTLAEKATYQYSRGGTDIDGPSIRLAETIARRWGNLETGVKELTRRDGVSECMAYAWDLETNYREIKTFSVRHWRDTKKGGYALRDERDIYELIANSGARRKRACILAIVDGDVIESAVKQCEATLRKKIEITPEFIAQLLDRFSALGVNQDMIEKRIQRRIDSLTPALAVQLRKIHNSLRDGMSVASDWFELPEAKADDVPPAGATKTDALKARMSRKAQAKAPPATEPPPAETAQEPAESDRGAPADDDNAPLSYAQIADRIQRATTLDVLDEAADLIGSISIAKQRKELIEMFDAKRDELDR